MSISNITQNQRGHIQHPWHVQYSPKCIMPGCNVRPYHDGQVHFSLCLSHLQKKELGPFRKRVHKEDYSTLFWMSDWGNANSRKELA